MNFTKDARKHMLIGARQAIGFIPPAIPFALIVGVAISESSVVGDFVGWSGSWLVFAGAAQLVAIDLLNNGSNALLVVATIAMINSRSLMYSGSINLKLRERSESSGEEVPQWFRIVGSYLLIDQAFALADLQPEELTISQRIAQYLGAGGLLWAVWQCGVAAGVLLGDVFPASWSLDFAPALLFGAMTVMSIRNSPALIAAMAALAAFAAFSALPSGGALVVAIVVGAVSGGIAESKSKSGSSESELGSEGGVAR